jgi:hypothetical protein
VPYFPSEGVGGDIFIATDNHRRFSRQHPSLITLCGYWEIVANRF